MLLAAHGFWWWCEHLIGIENASGATYLFWSGVFADVALFGAAFTFFRHKNCHVRGCWRLGHPDPEHGHPTCRIHSPHFDPAGRLLMPHVHVGLSRPHEQYAEGEPAASRPD